VKDSLHNASGGSVGSLSYTYRNDTAVLTIPVYPDTLEYARSYTRMYYEPMVASYLSDPAYKDYPVVGVTWRQAMAYCHWRSVQLQNTVKAAGQLKKGDSLAVLKFRLPTEAEWEYAALANIGRAKYEDINERRIYPWNGFSATGKKNKYLANFGAISDENGVWAKYHADDGAIGPAKVKSYPPNDFVLYDMAGNAAEWTIYETSVMNTDLLFEYGYNPDFDEMWDHRCYGHFQPPKRTGRELRLLDSIRMLTRILPTENLEQALQKIIERNHMYARFAHQHQDLNMRPGDNRVYPAMPRNSSDSLTYLFRYLDSALNYQLNEAAKLERQNAVVFAKNPHPRTVKGGSWADGLAYIMCANKEAFSEDKSSSRIGFRVVMNTVYRRVKE
jgi:formylglycine-generating enzyme required for sulfatase activity